MPEKSVNSSRFWLDSQRPRPFKRLPQIVPSQTLAAENSAPRRSTEADSVPYCSHHRLSCLNPTQNPILSCRDHPTTKLSNRFACTVKRSKKHKRLYIESGELVRGSYGWLAGGDDADAASIAGQMDDLHQGFLMKVFATVVPNTEARNMEQRQLGRALLEHIWGKSVMGSQLHEAVDWLIDASNDFKWSDLVRPFAEIPALRDRWGELETLAMRMANLLASVDGDVSVADNANLKAMQQQFDEIARTRTGALGQRSRHE